MNEYYEANKRSLILLTVMLFLLAVVLYFMLLRPLLIDYKNEQKNITELNQEIELLQAQINQLKESSDDVSLEQLILENKVPSERELDEYILALQQLELHTESRIESIEFAYDSSLQMDESEQSEDTSSTETEEVAAEVEAEADDSDAEATEEASTNEEESNVSAPDPELMNEKPAELQVMTIRISAISPNFEEIIELLKIIESNERISVVTSLEFTKPTETDIYFSENPSDIIPFEAELTTFYYAE